MARASEGYRRVSPIATTNQGGSRSPVLTVIPLQPRVVGWEMLMAERKKKLRGTALVFRDDKVLLVRDRGVTSFSLPGGSRKGNEEPFLCTAVRELYEELGMRARKAERIFDCDFESMHSFHKVTLIDTTDDPRVNDGELAEFLWWDQQTPVKRFAHVEAILRRYR